MKTPIFLVTADRVCTGPCLVNVNYVGTVKKHYQIIRNIEYNIICI